MILSLREKCPNTELFNPNTGKYGPEITPYVDTFHAVCYFYKFRYSMVFYQVIKKINLKLPSKRKDIYAKP